jgi:hypothetical protein
MDLARPLPAPPKPGQYLIRLTGDDHHARVSAIHKNQGPIVKPSDGLGLVPGRGFAWANPTGFNRADEFQRPGYGKIV